MLDYVFAIFFMGFPGVQILVLVSSIFLAINRNKLNKRVYGFFSRSLLRCVIFGLFQSIAQSFLMML